MTETKLPPDGRKRVIIKNINPVVANGRFPAKGTTGYPLKCSATIIVDGHDKLYCQLLYRYTHDRRWNKLPLKADHNDLWHAYLVPEKEGILEFKVQAWVSELQTWNDAVQKKEASGIDITAEEQQGFVLLREVAGYTDKAVRKKIEQFLSGRQDARVHPSQITDAWLQELTTINNTETTSSSHSFEVLIERAKAGFSTWYELFPRSCSTEPGKHGTFKDVARKLPELAEAGFDVIYLPPIHPIGKEKRKGRNNSLKASASDPGSPWAIGSSEGGHTAVHPELGSLNDFGHLLREAKKNDIEIALDIAFQCAPDHPYVKEHPEWFKWRPDGTVQYAENPPKKYEDILPFNFDSTEWKSLWEELLRIFIFWAEQGVRIFRVDNPHTKSLRFWEWVIPQLKSRYPDVILLSEAFTRPHIMEHLAQIGFSQSYTYFTWRNTAAELKAYMEELTKGPKQYYFRPNFWPNTPDILPAHLVTGGINMHIIRVVLAACLSSNYGLYGPVYERVINKPMPGKEEYTDNEKYEIAHWPATEPGPVWQIIRKVNHLRKKFRALQITNNIEFLECSNEQLLAFVKYDLLERKHLLIVVCMDPAQPQSGWIKLPLDKLNTTYNLPLTVHDELHHETYQWQQDWNYIALDASSKPAHIFSFINAKQ
jgi:starch synthase (maltosyl-transferring)